MAQPTYYYDVQQGSDEWLKLRLGVVTASEIPPIFAKQPDDYTLYSKGGDTYIKNKVHELIFEELKFFSTEATQWGHDHEEEARKLYETITKTTVNEVGFVKLFPKVGCSPDGLVGEDGLIEIKCPFKTDNHQSYIRKGEAPRNYKLQMLHQMYVTRRSWCDFFSYDPRIDDNYFLKRYTLEELLAELGECKMMYEIRIRQTVYQIELGEKIARAMLEHGKTMTVKIDNVEEDIEVWM